VILETIAILVVSVAVPYFLGIFSNPWYIDMFSLLLLPVIATRIPNREIRTSGKISIFVLLYLILMVYVIGPYFLQ